MCSIQWCKDWNNAIFRNEQYDQNEIDSTSIVNFRAERWQTDMFEFYKIHKCYTYVSKQYFSDGTAKSFKKFISRYFVLQLIPLKCNSIIRLIKSIEFFHFFLLNILTYWFWQVRKYHLQDNKISKCVVENHLTKKSLKFKNT